MVLRRKKVKCGKKTDSFVSFSFIIHINLLMCCLNDFTDLINGDVKDVDGWAYGKQGIRNPEPDPEPDI